MSKKKLTLSVDEHLSDRAKALARERGTSVSRLVEAFFATLDASDEPNAPTDPEGGPAPAEAPLSNWARRWRGAFAEQGGTDPDDSAWEERILAEEIADKHE